jgi:ribosomal protein S19E (S16A)
VEVNTSGTASSQGEKDNEDGSGNTVVANTILVLNDNANETIEGPNSIQKEKINNLSRMAVIRRERKEQGFSEEERNYLDKTIRESTAKAYDNVRLCFSLFNGTYSL